MPDNYDVIGPTLVSEAIIFAVVDEMDEDDHLAVMDAVIDAYDDSDFETITNENIWTIVDFAVAEMSVEIHGIISNAVLDSLSDTNRATISEDSLFAICIAVLVSLVYVILDEIKKET